MDDKFQILSSKDGKHSIIERISAPYNTQKDTWEVYIPDAGTRNNAVRVTRLLNAEEKKLKEQRAGRTNDGLT